MNNTDKTKVFKNEMQQEKHRCEGIYFSQIRKNSMNLDKISFSKQLRRIQKKLKRLLFSFFDASYPIRFLSCQRDQNNTYLNQYTRFLALLPYEIDFLASN